MEALQGPRASAVISRPTGSNVIGAGVMGGDIAAWCASRGLEVTLQDREMKYIEACSETCQGPVPNASSKTPEAVAAAQTRLIADVEGEGVGPRRCGDRGDFREPRCQARAVRKSEKNIFSRIPWWRPTPRPSRWTNWSDVFDDPTRLIGLHFFFNPVAKMPLVEVVYDDKTDGKRVKDGSSFATQIGKYALPVTSTPGFLVNRAAGTLHAQCNENASRRHSQGGDRQGSREIRHADGASRTGRYGRSRCGSGCHRYPDGR